MSDEPHIIAKAWQLAAEFAAGNQARAALLHYRFRAFHAQHSRWPSLREVAEMLAADFNEAATKRARELEVIL